MIRYVVNPATLTGQITAVEVSLEDVSTPDYVHAIRHGFIWENREEAELMLRHMLDFGRRIVEVNAEIKDADIV